MEAKCYFMIVDKKIKITKDLPPVIMPVPQIGSKVIIEGQEEYYTVIDVQYQLREAQSKLAFSLILVNVLLVKCETGVMTARSL